MKPILLSLLGIFIMIPHLIYAQFASEGDYKVYTFESLSEISNSGVSRTGNVFTVNNDLTISPTDTLRVDNNAIIQLGDLITIQIEGYGDFTPADTATFTRMNNDANPKGIYFTNNSESQHVASANIRNITFEYGGVRCFGEGKYVFYNCTFRNVNTEQAYSAISLGAVSAIVSQCNFFSNEGSAISSGSNMACSLIFKDNYLYDNTTANTNRPQINMSAPGDGVMEITGNTVIGEKRSKVGGISVANLLGVAGKNNVAIESNYVENCRYGITTNGMLNVQIKDNILINNNHDPNPNSGGSGISIYDTKGNQKVTITGNTITGHHWGITSIGKTNGEDANGPEVNLGNLDQSSTDYNPGLNVFKDNGNNGKLYDIYNNSPKTVYAQNNTWNVEIQTEEKIEEVVFHKKDNETLGEVIFMPAKNPNSIETTLIEIAISFNNKTRLLAIGEPYKNIHLYSISGKLVFENHSKHNTIKLPELEKGAYIVKITTGKGTCTKKIIM